MKIMMTVILCAAIVIATIRYTRLDAGLYGDAMRYNAMTDSQRFEYWTRMQPTIKEAMNWLRTVVDDSELVNEIEEWLNVEYERMTKQLEGAKKSSVPAPGDNP